MPTQFAEIFAALAAPFERDEVKQRKQANIQLSYVTARTVMNRLDDVVGPENWWDDYVPGEHSVLCRLCIRLPNGEVLKKADAGGYAGMADPGDDDKSGYADAFKRAAVKFGVGRYLYRDGVPRFEDGPVAEPTPSRPTPPPPAPRVAEAPRQAPRFTLPKAGTGEAFGFFKSLKDHFGRDIVKMVDDLARADEVGTVYKEWDQETLDRYAWRAVGYCMKLPAYQGELDHLEEKKEDPLGASREWLGAAAVELLRHRQPDVGPTPELLNRLIAEASEGRVTDLFACRDGEAMRAAAQAIAKLVPARKS